MGILRKPQADKCPHLGSADDPLSRQPRASDEHRCYAGAGRERIDLDHQRRFCLGSSYASCPFLTVNDAHIGPVEWISAWWRNVSPARPALTAAQLGQVAELGAAAAGGWLSHLALLTLETWRIARPQREAPPLIVTASAPPVAMAVYEPAAHVVVSATPPDSEPPPSTANAWFSRAKTAETLDEVIDCLKRATALEPDNQLFASSLERAKERRDAHRQAAKAKPVAPAASGPMRIAGRRPNPLAGVANAIRASVRLALSITALLLGSAWLLSALPAPTRQALLSASGLQITWLPDPRGVTSLVHVPLGGGYDLGLAVPYAIGFLALFVGLGILRREPSLSGRG
jgi:hypothetical protein